MSGPAMASPMSATPTTSMRSISTPSSAPRRPAAAASAPSAWASPPTPTPPGGTPVHRQRQPVGPDGHRHVDRVPDGQLPKVSRSHRKCGRRAVGHTSLEEPAQLVRASTRTPPRSSTLHMTAMPDPYTIDAFAFATWGGDFWVFIRTYGMGCSTDVYRVTSTDTRPAWP